MLTIADATQSRPLDLDASALTLHQKAFLQAYATTGRVREASRVSEVANAQHYRWLDKDPSYAYYFDLAKQIAADTMESEIIRRGMDGDREVVIHKGQPVFVWIGQDGEVRPDNEYGDCELKALYRYKKSDRLLLAAMAALDPRYRRGQEVKITQQINQGEAGDFDEYKKLPADANDLAAALRQLEECGLLESMLAEC